MVYFVNHTSISGINKPNINKNEGVESLSVNEILDKEVLSVDKFNDKSFSSKVILRSFPLSANVYTNFIASTRDTVSSNRTYLRIFACFWKPMYFSPYNILKYSP